MCSEFVVVFVKMLLLELLPVKYNLPLFQISFCTPIPPENTKDPVVLLVEFVVELLDMSIENTFLESILLRVLFHIITPFCKGLSSLVGTASKLLITPIRKVLSDSLNTTL